MRRLLVNDALNQLGERTFWNDLQEWFGCEFVGGEYPTLAEKADGVADGASLIIRNATWFPPIKADIPTISLLQDIIPEGPLREMQEQVTRSSKAVVYNSQFTADRSPLGDGVLGQIIPLPVDFSLFEPQNAMGCQQALGLPAGCVCWIGASQGAAGHVKGFDILRQTARENPDIPFVAVFKDAAPDSVPPNMRVFVRLPQSDLVRVIGACRVGLCTSRMESQHLAGIEMGACGLPMVAPAVGCYWKREQFGVTVVEATVAALTSAIRGWIATSMTAPIFRDQWRKEFDKPVVRAAWEELVAEVECSGPS